MRTAAIALLLFTQAGCGIPSPGSQDFTAPLPHGYFVHCPWADGEFVAPDGWNDSTPIIPAKVVELDHDDAYVIAKQNHLRRRSPDDPNDTFEELDPGVFSYWILDLRQPKAFGPLTKEHFDAKRKELGVSDALTLHDVNDYRP